MQQSSIWCTFFSFREELEKLRATVKDGRGNLVTKRNKMLNAAEEQLNKLNANLSKALSEVCPLSNGFLIFLQ